MRTENAADGKATGEGAVLTELPGPTEPVTLRTPLLEGRGAALSHT